MKKNIYPYFIALLSISFLALNGCKKLVEVNPPITSTNGDNVFDDNSTAIAAITGIYANMSNGGIVTTNGWLTNIGFITGLGSDELELYNSQDPGLKSYADNNITPTFSNWINIYKMILVANTAIEKLPDSKNVTPIVKNQLLGEAKFIRAFCYYYLINLYGDVPFAVTTDYKTNSLLPRTATGVIIEQMIGDLKVAKQLLSDNFVDKNGFSQTTERVRPNKWAASALLARFYLYKGDFQNAEIESSSLINNSALFRLVDINNVFTKNSNEVIWSLQPVGTMANKTANTPEGRVFNLGVIPASAYISYLRTSYVNEFDQRDLRRQYWISSVTVGGNVYYYPFKYKKGLTADASSEYTVVFRLAEQYLIRAEARIKLGKIADGIQDINLLRFRATDPAAPANQQLPQLSTTLSSSQALDAVLQERQYELFSEWGHRWFDLRRLGKINEILAPLKSGWQSNDSLWPLPQGDMYANPSLSGHQNPGY